MSAVLAFQVPPGKPVLRGIDHYWRVIRDLDGRGPWTVMDIRGLTGGAVDLSTIRDFVRRLVAGEIAYVDEHSPQGVLYRLRRSPLATPRLRRDGSPALQGRGQTAMWNVMRGPIGRGGFTASDLVLYGSTETIQIAPATALSYIKHLAQAEYLVCLRKGKPGQQGTYRLKPGMHTGPLPPLILRSQVVYDQNRGEAIGPVEAREVEP